MRSARLAELARLLTRSERDLAEFDGTIDSLGPLWAWAVEFARAGFPGIPADVKVLRATVEPDAADYAAHWRTAELLAHYLFEVAGTVFSEVEWRVNQQPGFEKHQKVAMVYLDDVGLERTKFPDEYFSAALWMVDDREYGSPDFLVNIALRGPLEASPPAAERILAMPRAASVLEPFLGGDESTPEFVLGADRPQPDAEPALEGFVGDELILAWPGSDVEELEAAHPIEAAPVVEVLSRLGFVGTDGAAPSSEDVLARDFSEFVLGDTAMAITLASGGRLRAVQLSSIRAYPAPWAELVGEFVALGERVGARLAREDEFAE